MDVRNRKLIFELVERKFIDSGKCKVLGDLISGVAGSRAQM